MPSIWGLRGGRGISTEGARRRAREEAQREYDEQRNLRPVTDAPEALVRALEAAADRVGGVRWITLGEYRDDHGGLSRMMVGVRLGPGGPADFASVEAAVSAAVREALATAVRLEVVELDADVDETMADGTPNPYVVVRRR
ncbi:MAG TPA: hypothetical protein VGB42_03990 [Candidatus Thermoplasmatota archaeon]